PAWCLSYHRCAVFRAAEPRGLAILLAVVARAIPEFRAANAGRAMAADDVAVGVLAQHFVDKDVLRNDDVAFHAHHFRDVGDAAGGGAAAGRPRGGSVLGGWALLGGARRLGEGRPGDARLGGGGGGGGRGV